MRKLVTGWQPLLALAFLAVLSWVALSELPDGLAPGRLHVWFLDVGQGDAILIQSPDGRQILIDGGPSPSALAAQLGEVMPFWDRSLDVVVLTHPDADHLAGLIPLFEKFSISSVVDAVDEDDPAASAWIDAAQAARSARQSAARGMRFAAGAVEMTVLNPPVTGGDAESDNNDSIVLRLDYGAASLLLTGDAEAAAEQEMLAAGAPLQATALKVAHHGSKAGTTPEFLAAVNPQVAVVSVGADNRFGHPAPELLARLSGIETLRTDQRGRIELISDGTGWTVRAER